MTCSEFQKVLPYIIESGGTAEEEAHLRSCAVCSDLVQDLRYIAEQAKLLVPMEDPNPRVWDGIQGALQREGLVRPARGTGRFRSPEKLIPGKLGTLGGLLCLAAVLAVAILLVGYRNNSGRDQQLTQATTKPLMVTVGQARLDREDAQLLDAVQNSAPSMLATYRENLDSVNAYIWSAKSTLDQNPDDELAHEALVRAYDAKAMMYEMALSHAQQQ